MNLIKRPLRIATRVREWFGAIIASSSRGFGQNPGQKWR
jgi:hypothetical protein